MIVDAEARTGPIQAGENDPRITRIGRILRATAMDELPQLWNIFCGDMSFVGPRALRPGEIEVKGNGAVERLEDVPGFVDRCAVRPGLTGVAQIYAPRDVVRRQQVPLRPLLHSPAVVLVRRAAHPAVVLDHVSRAMGGPRPQVVRCRMPRDASTWSSSVGARGPVRRRPPCCRRISNGPSRRTRQRRRARCTARAFWRPTRSTSSTCPADRC